METVSDLNKAAHQCRSLGQDAGQLTVWRSLDPVMVVDVAAIWLRCLRSGIFAENKDPHLYLIGHGAG